MKTRDVIAGLERGGWYQVASKGGHRQFRHPVRPGRVTVPYHGGNADIFDPLLRSIERQAGVTLR